jgi:hypothetical protein
MISIARRLSKLIDRSQATGSQVLVEEQERMRQKPERNVLRAT